jgi:hypothetical protein
MIVMEIQNEHTPKTLFMSLTMVEPVSFDTRLIGETEKQISEAAIP